MFTSQFCRNYSIRKRPTWKYTYPVYWRGRDSSFSSTVESLKWTWCCAGIFYFHMVICLKYWDQSKLEIILWIYFLGWLSNITVSNDSEIFFFGKVICLPKIIKDIYIYNNLFFKMESVCKCWKHLNIFILIKKC